MHAAAGDVGAVADIRCALQVHRFGTPIQHHAAANSDFVFDKDIAEDTHVVLTLRGKRFVSLSKDLFCRILDRKRRGSAPQPHLCRRVEPHSKSE